MVDRLSRIHIDSVGEVTGGGLNALTSSHSLSLGRLKKVSLASIGEDR